MSENAELSTGEEFAVLGRRENGDVRMSEVKYDDAGSAQEYANRFGGRVYRREVGEWVTMDDYFAVKLRAWLSDFRPRKAAK